VLRADPMPPVGSQAILDCDKDACGRGGLRMAAGFNKPPGRLALGAMLHAERRGDYPTLRAHLKLNGERVRTSPDASVREEFAALVARTAEAFEYERIHGEWSLLKWDDPVNQDWISRGILNIPDAVSLAAKRGVALRVP